MEWTAFLMKLITENLASSICLISGVSLGVVIIVLWDSRIWFRRLASVLLPEMQKFLLRGHVRREQDHEYLVSRVMQHLERRKAESKIERDKDRRVVKPVLQARGERYDK